MIRVEGLRTALQSSVAKGQPLLFPYGTRWVPALRFAGTEAVPDAVLLLDFGNAGYFGSSPALLSGPGARCIVLGAPRLVWDGEVSAIGSSSYSDSPVGAVVLHSSGPLISGRYGPQLRDRGYRRVADGEMVSPDVHDYRLRRWEIGLMNIDGKFQSVFKFPAATPS